MFTTRIKVFLFITLSTLNSCALKKEPIYSDNQVLGTFLNKKEKIELKISLDRTFILKQDFRLEICKGSWKLEDGTVYLFCTKPALISEYFINYNFNIDAKYICILISDDVLLFEGKKLKKVIR